MSLRTGYTITLLNCNGGLIDSMNTFDDRKKGFEAKYIKDQESEFIVRAKRNKLIGLWAAEITKPNDIDAYVKEVRLSDLEKPGDDDIIDKLLKDFNNTSSNLNREDIVKKIEELGQQAMNDFMKEKEGNL